MINPYELEKANLDDLPDCSGIYFFYDKENKLIYVGRSVSIRDRIYHHLHYGRFWVEYARSISFIKCDKNDIRRLECEYINKYYPMYNYESGYHEYDDPCIQAVTPDIERAFRKKTYG